jgi:hypothetical protein
MSMFSASSLVGMGASSASARELSDANAKAAKLSGQMYQEGKSYLTPYTDSGTSANRLYGDAIGLNGKPAQESYYRDFQTDPGFQTSLDNALDTTTKRYALMGRTGGGMANALLKTGQLAMNDQYNQRLNRLSGVADSGRSTATTLANLGQGYAEQAGKYIVGGGQARAEGIQGRAQASMAGLNAEAGWGQFQKGLNNGYTVNRAF